MSGVHTQKDVLAGFAFVVAGACFAYVASNYERGTAVEMGPGYFPFGLGLLLAGLGVVVLIKAFTAIRSAEDRVNPIDVRAVVCVVGSVILFGMALEPLGLVVSIFILVIVASFGSHERNMLRAVAAAAVLNVLCVLTFVVALRVQMPVWPEMLR